MRLDRRHLIGLFGAGAAGTAASAAMARSSVPARFNHGVASGDPAMDSVLLWTRVTTDAPDVEVRWQIASDPDFTRLAGQGVSWTGGSRDHTVKVIADRLQPGVDYWYRFGVGETWSPIGRTRTLPRADSEEPVVLAVASCSLHPQGLFNAYDAIARMERLDAVVHLGDYIYEYGAAPDAYGMRNGARLGRVPEPAHEIVSLADYRTRHAQYKADPDLQAAHARAPWIVVYDDHESANNAFDGGAENHDEGEGDWATRKAAALKAYFEWMPVREPAPGQSLEEATERGFRFGRSASLHMLDTRLAARDRQLEYATDFYAAGPDGRPAPDRAAFMARLNAEDRRLVGDSQMAWIERDTREAVEAGCAWQLIGNQVVMARVRGPDLGALMPPAMIEQALSRLPEASRESVRRAIALFAQDLPYNLDAWDGYPAERERLYAALTRARARPVVLSGDSHTFWVNRLKDRDRREVGVEFGTTGITSPSPAAALGLPQEQLAQVMASQNDEVDHIDFGPRGFLTLTLTPETATTELVGVSTIESKPYEARVLRTYVARAGEAGRIADFRQT